MMNLLFLILVTCLILLGVGVMFYSWHKKKLASSDPSIPSDITDNSNNNLSVEEDGEFLELLPKVITLSNREVLDFEKMHEIKDRGVLSKVNAIIPQFANNVYDSINKKKLQNINELLQNDKLYKVVIPPGAELYKAKDKIGAFRGGYHVNGQLAGQAHLVKVSPTAQKVARTGEIVANAMNVASMVVGQYYMAEVDAKLEQLQAGVDKVIEFQETQFKSKILSLIPKVGKITKFNIEIMENDEIRQRSLGSLVRYEDEAIELLQQVNSLLENLITSNLNTSYAKYKEVIFEVEKLTIFQQYLISIMEEIAQLTYLLNGGKVSSEYCYSSLGNYLEQSNTVRDKLAQWHNNQSSQLGIQIQKSRITKKGFEGAVFYLPGMVQNDLKYKKMNKDIVDRIKKQSVDKLHFSNTTDNVFERELQILVHNGKYYYLND
ncbi:hypothetical protein [Streptococcus sp. DAT741]|nr:hypothetical protein [Streptococcus sp. DAT741]